MTRPRYLFSCVCMTMFFLATNALMAQDTSKQATFPKIIRGTSIGTAECLVDHRFIYKCSEAHDSLCFEVFDRETNANISPKKALYALTYTKKKHQRAQSLQILVDTGASAYKNRVYIAWADQKNGKDNWDVYLIYSNDAGLNWTEPILISYAPNHKNQWSPKLHLNPNTGDVFLLYFDAADFAQGRACNITLAQSNNGGLKYTYYRLNEKPLTVNPNGGLNTFIVNKGNTYALWSSGATKQPFRFFLTMPNLNQTLSSFMPDVLQTDSWITYHDSLALSLTCTKALSYTIEISKPIEPQFKTRVIKHGLGKNGNNTLLIDMKALKLPAGNYVLTLYYNGTRKFIWVTDNS